MLREKEAGRQNSQALSIIRLWVKPQSPFQDRVQKPSQIKSFALDCKNFAVSKLFAMLAPKVLCVAVERTYKRRDLGLATFLNSSSIEMCLKLFINPWVCERSQNRIEKRPRIFQMDSRTFACWPQYFRTERRIAWRRLHTFV